MLVADSSQMKLGEPWGCSYCPECWDPYGYCPELPSCRGHQLWVKSKSNNDRVSRPRLGVWRPRPIFLSLRDFLLDSYCLLCCSAFYDERTGLQFTGVGVLLAADRQSTSSSGYRASLWDPSPHFILLFFFRLTNTWFFFLRRPLWRENGSVVFFFTYNWSWYLLCYIHNINYCSHTR
jgi:hypothetical protein